jgi:hypothetical protein
MDNLLEQCLTRVDISSTKFMSINDPVHVWYSKTGAFESAIVISIHEANMLEKRMRIRADLRNNEGMIEIDMKDNEIDYFNEVPFIIEFKTARCKKLYISKRDLMRVQET